MRPTILELKNHRYHLQHALRHFQEISSIEENLPIPQDVSACEKILLEHHDHSLRWELEQAQAAIFSCHQLQVGSIRKRQCVARIACIRLSRFGRNVQGVRLP